MKRILFLLVCIVLISCKNEEKKYFIHSNIKDLQTGLIEKKIDTVEFLNDSAAYIRGYKLFCISNSLDKYWELKKVKNLTEQISFEVYDFNGKKLSKMFSDSYLDSVRNTIEKSTMEKYSNNAEIKVSSEDIEKQFSSWNGAHIKLQELIKENMNDPDSYEHIETKYKNLGDVLEVVTKYRGSNSFGAKVVQTTTAKCDLLNGDVLTID